MQSPDSSLALDIRLFGSFAVRIDGRPMASLHSRKGLHLLALLTLRHGREVERDWLAGTLWPESTERQALHNLRQTLSHLRRALSPESHRIQSPRPHTLRLDLSGSTADVVAFDHAIACADEASLKEAIALYSGPLLEDCLEDWAVPEREACEQAYLAALETLARRREECGEFGEAARLLRLAVGVDPLRESAQRRLMCVLASDGNLTAVREVYRDLRLRLHRELNAVPDPETTAEFRRLSDASKFKPKEMARDTERRLLARSEPPRLPHPLTELIGRENDVREIRRRLAASRLVTLTGTGGVGKSRLAMAVAGVVADEYADGVWFVELAPLSDPTLISQTVATTLGVKESPGRSLDKTVSDHLRERQALLVLDNCEHLLSECAHLTSAWLGDCSSVRVLATSRQSLGLTGETAWRVPSLSLPDPGESVGDVKNAVSHLVEYAAIRLFVERATGAYPAFKVNEHNVLTIAQICRRLDGIPLAIKFAAARVRVLPVEEIASRLGDCFRLLTGGSSAAMPRQQTLQATLDWSHDLLAEQDRVLLRRLSVFAGGWSLKAAEKICAGEGIGAEKMLDLLTALVDKSLVVYEEHQGKARFHLLETVRQYARERMMESGEVETVRRSHCDHYLSLVHSLSPTYTKEEWSTWLQTIGREYDNLRACLEVCLAHSDLVQDGLRAAVALSSYWWAQSLPAEGYSLLEAFLSRPEMQEPSLLRAKALLCKGWLAVWRSECSNAIPLLEEALQLARQFGDSMVVVDCLYNLAGSYFDSAQPERARPYYEEGLAAARESKLYEKDVTWRIKGMLGGLSSVCRIMGEHVAAREYAEELFALGDGGSAYYADLVLANALVSEGRVSEAREHFLRVLSIMQREAKFTAHAISALERFAAIEVPQGRWERAARMFGACESSRLSMGSPRSVLDHRDFYDAALAGLHAALDVDALAEAWEEGRHMTLSQAVDYALETCER